MKPGMNRLIVIAVSSYLCGCAAMRPAPATKAPPPAAVAGAPVAGAAPLGVTVLEMEAIIIGWSAQRDLLEKPVVNDRNETIGVSNDIIITPDNAVSYAIIHVADFTGITGHAVAIPMDHFKITGANLMLPGATRDVLRRLPPFKYAR